MPKWEYRAIQTGPLGLAELQGKTWKKFCDAVHAVDELNNLGEEGWELTAALPVELADGIIYFKRPKP